MNVFRKTLSVFIFAMIVALHTAAVPGLQPLEESPAYQKYKNRPSSDFSKLLFLIERFGDSNVLVLYDGQRYKAKLAAGIARWFLARNYRKQKPRDWIMQWCNTSVFSGRLIYVEFPDGTKKLSRETLLEELSGVEKASNPSKPVPASSQGAV